MFKYFNIIKKKLHLILTIKCINIIFDKSMSVEEYVVTQQKSPIVLIQIFLKQYYILRNIKFKKNKQLQCTKVKKDYV